MKRYKAIVEGVEKFFNVTPDHNRFLFQSCIFPTASMYQL